PGVLAGQVPPLPRYYEALRLLPARPARLIGCAVAVPPLASAASLPPARTLAGGLGPLGPAAPPRPVQAEETGRSPRFLGNPAAPMLGSPTPAGPTRQAVAACRHGPPHETKGGLPRQCEFRGSMTGPE